MNTARRPPSYILYSKRPETVDHNREIEKYMWAIQLINILCAVWVTDCVMVIVFSAVSSGLHTIV